MVIFHSYVSLPEGTQLMAMFMRRMMMMMMMMMIEVIFEVPHVQQDRNDVS